MSTSNPFAIISTEKAEFNVEIGF